MKPIFLLSFISFRFKPVDIRHVVRPFKDDFELLFCKTFSRKQNVKFLQHMQVK